MVIRENTLTPRERELLGWLVRGLSNAEIADAMGIGMHAVRLYLSNIKNKLGIVSSRNALINWAICHGYRWSDGDQETATDRQL